MILNLWIAFRTLFSKRSRYAYSAIGWIAVIGLVLGVASQNIAVSILEGFEKSFTQAILGFNAHLVLMREGEMSQGDESNLVLKALQDSSQVLAETPFLYRESLIAHHSKVKGVVLKGIAPLTFEKVYDVKTSFFSKDLQLKDLNLEDKKEALAPLLMGSDLAQYLGVTPEDPVVSILAPQGDLKTVADVKNFVRFKVIGTFASGLYEYDSQFVLLGLGQAQNFFQAPGQISGYEMRLKKIDEAHGLAKNLEEKLGPLYQAIAWDELNAEIFQALRLEKRLFFIIMGIIILIAVANLIGLIVVLVADQSREANILRAMGMPAKTLARIFTLQGMIIAVMGVGLGTLLGWGVSAYLSHHSLLGIAKEVYLVSELPVAVSWENFSMTILFSLLVSYFATRWVSGRILKREVRP